jgi:16S rRNA (cytosine967-C5)-methyltransferase
VKVLDGRPLRAALREVLEKHEKLGGKERRFVAFACRELSRHLRLLEAFSKAAGWPASVLQLQEDEALIRYAVWRHRVTGADIKRVLVEIGLPGPIRPRSVPDKVLETILSHPGPSSWGDSTLDILAAKHSFPSWLAQRLAGLVPESELDGVMAGLNREPKVMLRARPVGSGPQLAEQLNAQGFDVSLVPGYADALVVDEERRAIFESGFMKQGRLQVIDIGSQALVALCGAQPGMTVVDYCAGAGGKTLALADVVGPTGRVFAHDSSPKRLAECKRRVSEWKLRHVSFPSPCRLDLADVVLVDAPCSGVGSLAREPDQKWKLSAKVVEEFVAKQKAILDEVAPQLKVGARLVYATCSLLKEEDEAVVDSFLAKHPSFRLDAPALRVWPHESVGAGFYGARLAKL